MYIYTYLFHNEKQKKSTEKTKKKTLANILKKIYLKKGRRERERERERERVLSPFTLERRGERGEESQPANQLLPTLSSILLEGKEKRERREGKGRGG